MDTTGIRRGVSGCQVFTDKPSCAGRPCSRDNRESSREGAPLQVVWGMARYRKPVEPTETVDCASYRNR